MFHKKKYILRVQNTPVEVSRECYKLFYKSRRREKYLAESDQTHGTVSYHALGTDDYTGEEIIPDPADSVDDSVEVKLMTGKLRRCLQLLSEDERQIITEFYYNNKSERKLALEMGIPYMTLHDRKVRILAKLRRLMES